MSFPFASRSEKLLLSGQTPESTIPMTTFSPGPALSLPPADSPPS
jgi:hypothetical protein